MSPPTPPGSAAARAGEVLAALRRSGRIQAALEAMDGAELEALGEQITAALARPLPRRTSVRTRTGARRRSVQVLIPRPAGASAGTEKLWAYGYYTLAQLCRRTVGAIRRAVSRGQFAMHDFESVVEYYLSARRRHPGQLTEIQAAARCRMLGAELEALDRAGWPLVQPAVRAWLGQVRRRLLDIAVSLAPPAAG